MAESLRTEPTNWSPEDGQDAAASGRFPARWWRTEGDRVLCELCPRSCALKDGDRGFCFVRQNLDQRMVLTTFGRSTGFCIDPIEKKPLNHFFPGTSVLSFGTAGCNLGCKFCQNWDISKSRQVARISEQATPEHIAEAARSLGCRSVAYTYNDPVIWAEYAIETAKACRALGVKSVAVTAGYITPQARKDFYEYIDAANVDLKAFAEDFYHKLTSSHLEPVLDTLQWLRNETDVWIEITNLVIPDANDDPDDIRRLCDWILTSLGDDVPVHFSAFHPDYRMLDRPRTPHATLIAARDTALQAGLRYVYLGNLNDTARQSTYCSNCGKLVIERDWYVLGTYSLHGNRCRHCGHAVSGHFDDGPGDWGNKRVPVDMREFAPSRDVMTQAIRQANAVLKAQDSNSRDVSPHTPPQPLLKKDSGTMNTPAPTQIDLDEAARQTILQAAAAYVRSATCKERAAAPDLAAAELAELAVSGVFVSLKRKGQLRSCCGSFGASAPLEQSLREAAHRTATSDPRFPPISPSELPYLDMEVWLLFAPEKVSESGSDRIGAVTVGKHGLQIIRGGNRGLLLPGVPVDHGWQSEEFLNQVCVKAGLPPTAWRDDSTTLYRFQGEVVRGSAASVDEPTNADTPTLLKPIELDRYVEYCRNTVDAIMRGATPAYYCDGVCDGNVNGLLLIASQQESNQELSVWRLSIKNTMPLQSTLFTLCQDMANVVRRRGWVRGGYRVDLAIAYDPSMHGTAASPDLAGVDTQQRSLLVLERSRSGWSFDQDATAQEVLQTAIQAAQVSDPAFAPVYSLAMQSTRRRIQVASAPRPSGGAAIRTPAVSGTFYPGDPTAVNRMLDEMLAGEVTRQACSAVLVPHAGWRFSGSLAADVLKRVQFPSHVIAFGPKHTAPGIDWAVAPHQRWQLPGGGIDSDVDLAARLADAVPEFQLDAAAHQQEHCIEVQLPIIARLSPQTRVVAVTIGAGNLDRCDSIARSLARCLRELDELPLLLISSDMNHYANDDETRRLDALALAALDRLDPDALFRTVRGNQISMCGVVPAVIVLKTLQKLDRLHESYPVGYTTSAEASGDTTRVVGYAGRLFLP